MLPRRLLIAALIAVLLAAAMPYGAISAGSAETTLSCAVVQRVVAARTAQLTERSDLAESPGSGAPRTDVQVAQHPRPHFRPTALPMQSLLSVYRI